MRQSRVAVQGGAYAIDDQVQRAVWRRGVRQSPA